MKGLYRVLFLILLGGMLAAGCRRAPVPAPEPEASVQAEPPASAEAQKADIADPALADPDPVGSLPEEGAADPSGAEASSAASPTGKGAAPGSASPAFGGGSGQTQQSDRSAGEAAAPETPPGPLEGLGYTLLWEAPLPAEADQPQAAVAISLDGLRAGLRLGERLLLLETGKPPRQVPVPAGQSLALSPTLDGWFVNAPLAAGNKLQALNWDGTPRWEAEAPPGELYVAPTGVLLVTRQSEEAGYTHAFGPDGDPLWQTDEAGGALSFAADGSVLIWDAYRGWQLRTPDGALLRRVAPLSEVNPRRRLSADGRVMVEPETGLVEPVAQSVPEGEAEGEAARKADGASQQPQDELTTFYGPGRLFADNGADLYLFERSRGRYSRLEAFDAGGRPLWSVPAGAQYGVVSPDGGEVWLFSVDGVAVLDGATGERLAKLKGVAAIWFSPDGRHALVWDESRLGVYQRPDGSQRSSYGGDAPRPGNI